MNQDRREFIKGTVGALGMAAAAGCLTRQAGAQGSGSMCNFKAKPLPTIHVGFIGLGGRGMDGLHRVMRIPNVEATALCDLRTEAVEEAEKWLRENKKPGAMRKYSGTEESWKGVCDDPNVDVVYIVTPAPLHAEEEIYAMEHGKHVLVEVPGAQTVDECWAIIETSEKTRRHCMMLENCCYGEEEMLAWELCHTGLLGTLTHAEGGYIHPLVWRQLETHFRNRAKMKPGTVVHSFGNTYPTHALGPICQYMDINRGDYMAQVVSVSSCSAAHTEFARATYKPTDWQNNIRWLTGDMNTSIIKTAKGRTIMMQIDMSTPRPYSRINLIQGTKGCLCGYPSRVYLSKRPGGDANSFADEAKMKWLQGDDFKKFSREHRHPLWKTAGAYTKLVNDNAHGGMDQLMDIRWAYCLQNGLPLDMDVYDLAAWSAIVPCSAESDRQGGVMVDLPDFTRGGWKTAKPVEIGGVDLLKMGFDPATLEKAAKAWS